MNAGRYSIYSAMCSICIYYDTRPCIFYGGMVRRKNVGNTMMQCVFIMGVSVIMWVLVGYAYLSVETMVIGEQNGLALTELE